MADAIVIFDGPGPLVQSATFTSETDGPVVFVLTGTAWTQTAGELIGCNLYLDGNGIGNAAMCFSNEATSHKALRTTLIPYDNMTIGPHSIEIVPLGNNTTSDINDYFQVTMLY